MKLTFLGADRESDRQLHTAGGGGTPLSDRLRHGAGPRRV